MLLAMVHGEEESLCNESGSSYIAVGNFEAQKGSVQVRQPDVSLFSMSGEREVYIRLIYAKIKICTALYGTGAYRGSRRKLALHRTSQYGRA